MRFSSRRAAGLLTVAAAGLVLAATGASAASADVCGSSVCGSGATQLYSPDERVWGPYTGGISPITGYQQSPYGMESAWVDANQDTIYAHCPGSRAPYGPQNNLATITGELLQSPQGRQLTDTVVATNDAYGCSW